MSDQIIGVYGAKAQSWRRANPRDVLNQLLIDNPTADRPALLRRFQTLMREDEYADHLSSIVEYWFANNYASLTAPAPDKRLANLRRARQTAKIRNEIKAGITAKAGAMLLDLMLPNGKKLRDSTFGYCKSLGGALSRVGIKGKPSQLVGAVLSERQVRDAFKEA